MISLPFFLYIQLLYHAQPDLIVFIFLSTTLPPYCNSISKQTLFKCRPIYYKDHNANTKIIQEIEKQQQQLQQLNTTRKQLRSQEKYQFFTL